MENSTKLETSIIEKIKGADTNASGFIKVVEGEGTVIASGQISSEKVTDPNIIIEDVLTERGLGNKILISNVKNSFLSGLRVTSVDISGEPSTISTVEERETLLDEIDTLYIGELPVDVLSPSEGFKKLNFEFFDRLRAIHDVFNFVTPIIVDKNLKVIDGNTRLEVLKLNGNKNAPVVVLNVDGEKATALKLILNRTGEWQRWIFPEVDQWVDSIPVLQPILEPIGFFSNTMLPKSFFTDTIVRYSIDEYSDQQANYVQDVGLAAWAKAQRDKAFERENQKIKARKKTRNREGLKSLFSLEPQEEDFIPTVDIQEVMDNHTFEQRKVAGEVTDRYDEYTRKIKEEKGQPWQDKRRSPRQRTEDNRLRAMEQMLNLNGNIDGEDKEENLD